MLKKGHILVIAVLLVFTVPLAYGYDGTLFLEGLFEWFSSLFSSIQVETFDCAKQFDKIARYYSLEIKDKQAYSQTQASRIIDTANELGRTFLDNRCAGSVNDWAYRSDFEVIIWNSGMDWNSIAHMEKLYNHDIECPVNYDPICSLKQKG